MIKSAPKKSPPSRKAPIKHARKKPMATTPERTPAPPQREHEPPPREQSQQAAKTDDKGKPEEKALSKEDAELIFESGGKLKKKGDPDDKWFAVGRVRNQLAVCYPLTDELKKKLLEMELVSVPDAPPHA